MSNRKEYVQHLRLWLIVLSGVSLLGLCLAACSQTTWSQWLNPVELTLLSVIELPNEIISDQIAITAKGYVYVTHVSGSVAILEKATLVKLLALPQNREHKSLDGQIVVHPQTDLVYLTDDLNDVMYVLRGTAIVSTVTDVGLAPSALAIHPSTGYVYVGGLPAIPNTLGGIVSVITQTHVITQIPIGLAANVLTPDERNRQVYVGQPVVLKAVFPPEQQALLAVIDETSLITMTSLGYPWGDGSINAIEVNPNTGEVYMIENLATLVYWHGDVIKRLNLAKLGYTALNDIAIDRRTNLVYVSSWGDPRSHVVVLDQDQIVAAIVVGRDPRQIAIDETHDAIYVANRLSGSISVLRGAAVLQTIKTNGGGPMHLGLDEARGYLYAANSDSHSIAVFRIGP